MTPPAVSPSPNPSIDGPTYKEITIGSGSFAEKVSFAYPPPPGSPNYDAYAAIALAHNFNALDKFRITHGISDLLSPFRPTFTLSTSTIESDVKGSVFDIVIAFLNPTKACMSALSFYDSDGDQTQLPLNVRDRFAEHMSPIQFVQVESTLDVTTIDPRIPSKSFTFVFYLSLPQSPPTNEVRQLFAGAVNDDDDGAIPAAGADDVPASVRRAVAVNPVNTNRPSFTYTGGFTFLESCAEFGATFGDVLQLKVYSTSSFVTKTALSPSVCFDECVSYSSWSISKTLLWADVVGGTEHVSQTIPVYQVQSLIASTTGMVVYSGNKRTERTPTESYHKLNALIPLLDEASINEWGFNLPAQYLHGLSYSVRTKIQERHSPFPSPVITRDRVATLPLQMATLREIRSCAQSAYDNMQETRRTMLNIANPRSSHSNSYHGGVIDPALSSSIAPASIDTIPSAAAPVSAEFMQQVVTASVQAALVAVQGPTRPPVPPPQVLHPVPPPGPSPFAPSHAGFTSAAEQTIAQARSTDSLCDPLTGYCSKYPANFHGCYGCGSISHSFRMCLHRLDPAFKKAFHQELYCRHKNSRPLEPHPTYGYLDGASKDIRTNPLVQPTGIPTAVTPPTTIGTSIAPSNLTQPYRPSSPKRTRFSGSVTQLTFSASPQQHTTSPAASRVLFTANKSRPCPIVVSNLLPHAPLMLCGTADSSTLSAEHVTFVLWVLLDTGAGLNTGQLAFHQDIAKRFPRFVQKLIYFDGADPFDPLFLHGILDESARDQSPFDTNLNRLDGLITYFTPYADQNSGNQITITFALGANVSVPTILGLPTLTSLHSVLDLAKGKLTCNLIDEVFDIVLQHAGVIPPTDTLVPTKDATPVRHEIGVITKTAAPGITAPDHTPAPDNDDDSMISVASSTANPLPVIDLSKVTCSQAPCFRLPLPVHKSPTPVMTAAVADVMHFHDDSVITYTSLDTPQSVHQALLSSYNLSLDAFNQASGIAQDAKSTPNTQATTPDPLTDWVNLDRGCDSYQHDNNSATPPISNTTPSTTSLQSGNRLISQPIHQTPPPTLSPCALPFLSTTPLISAPTPAPTPASAKNPIQTFVSTPTNVPVAAKPPTAPTASMAELQMDLEHDTTAFGLNKEWTIVSNRTRGVHLKKLSPPTTTNPQQLNGFHPLLSNNDDSAPTTDDDCDVPPPLLHYDSTDDTPPCAVRIGVACDLAPLDVSTTSPLKQEPSQSKKRAIRRSQARAKARLQGQVLGRFPAPTQAPIRLPPPISVLASTADSDDDSMPGLIPRQCETQDVDMDDVSVPTSVSVSIQHTPVAITFSPQVPTKDEATITDTAMADTAPPPPTSIIADTLSRQYPILTDTLLTTLTTDASDAYYQATLSADDAAGGAGLQTDDTVPPSTSPPSVADFTLGSSTVAFTPSPHTAPFVPRDNRLHNNASSTPSQHDPGTSSIRGTSFKRHVEEFAHELAQQQRDRDMCGVLPQEDRPYHQGDGDNVVTHQPFMAEARATLTRYAISERLAAQGSMQPVTQDSAQVLIPAASQAHAQDFRLGDRTLVISIPPKIWRPKPKCKYTAPPESDIDEDLFIFPSFGQSLSRPKYSYVNDRSDIILWDPSIHQAEFDKVVSIPTDLEPRLCTALTAVITRYWDSFIAEGVNRPILGWEFHIDTGTSPPVACRQSRYGIHESKIIMTQVQGLFSNGWIKECSQGGWCSVIVLAPKPHQEDVKHIDDFVWRLCVSYRGLNAVTKPFTFPIPRCDDALDNFGTRTGTLFWICVDAKAGYHQIAVALDSQEKLAFYLPDGSKVTWTVMPFGPMNAPAVYTCMMFSMRREWTALFEEKFPSLNAADVRIDLSLIQVGDRQVVDDILLYCNDPFVLILFFDCVCAIFVKYRISFNPSKCEFFLKRLEWIGHDMLIDGNAPASGKYDCIRDWPLPTTGESLGSFTGLITFYGRFIPWHEIHIQPLRSLERQHRRKPIPPSAWTAPLRKCWEQAKLSVLRDPLLRRFDPGLPSFLKTDWSARGMGFILMQPADDDASRAALETLRTTGAVEFDTLMSGGRLQPVRFGSRRCSDRESHFHSFTGEIAAFRWAIAILRVYLWGVHFYWICDCSAVKEVVEYTGDIHQVRRWSQELLGYFFTCVHRPCRMMRDVDALTRGRHIDGPEVSISSVGLFVDYSKTAEELHREDILTRPLAYQADTFQSNPFKIPATVPSSVSTTTPIAVLHSSVVFPTNLSFYHTPVLVSHPLSFLSTSIAPTVSHPSTSKTTSWESITPVATLAWISLSSFTGSLVASALDCHPLLRNIPCLVIEPSPIGRRLISVLLPHAVTSGCSWGQSVRTLLGEPKEQCPIISDFISTFPSITGFDCTCPFERITAQITWLQHCSKIITRLVSSHQLQCCILNAVCSSSQAATLSFHSRQLFPATSWQLMSQYLSCATLGDSVDTHRWYLLLSSRTRTDGHFQAFSDPIPPISSSSDAPRFGYHVRPEFNCPSRSVVTFNTFPFIAYDQLDSYKSHSFLRIRDPQQPGSILSQDQHLILADVYCPDFPAPEPMIPTETSLFDYSFGLPFTDALNRHHVRAAQSVEILSCYSFPDILSHPDIYELPPKLISPLLRSSSPFATASAMSQIIINSCFRPHGQATNDSHITCLLQLSRPLPTNDDWSQAYQADNETALLHKYILCPSTQELSEKEIRLVNQVYRPYLRDNRIQFVHGRIIVYQKLSSSNRPLALIVVPTSFRRLIFDAYHATPAGGHFGEYKTLHQIRLRFIWPKCRQDINNWVSICPECVLTRSAVRQSSELIYSWPVSSPFYILHVDIWAPGDSSSIYGFQYLLTAMCDLTGFVLLAHVPDLTASTLAAAFMTHILLKVGCCGIICPDAASSFKDQFRAMCTALQLPYSDAARGNHKAVSVERFFRYLNKAMTVAIQTRGTNKVSVEAAHLAGYAWNASPIDGTDIIRSVAAVGRPFRFPVDNQLTIPVQHEPFPASLISPGPSLSVHPSVDRESVLHEYLRLGQSQSQFAVRILQLLTEERRTSHAERKNLTRSPQAFQVGDIVTVLVQVNSNAATDTVAKLSYRRRGPYLVITSHGNGSYNLRKLYDSNSPPIKHLGQHMTLLPPALFPCQPLDCADQRFMDLHYAPKIAPLAPHLGIEGYNLHWFDPTNAPSATQPPSFDLSIDYDPSVTTIATPKTATLPAPINTVCDPCTSPPIYSPDNKSPAMTDLTTTPVIINRVQRALDLSYAIAKSTDRLFFVSVRLPGTLRPQWYLVQVDLTQYDNSDEINVNDSKTTGLYFCHFCTPPISDKKYSHPESRWWPIWHKFTTDRNDVVTYGDQVEIFPNRRRPSSKLYIPWADTLDLCDPLVFLLGPFDFNDPKTNPRDRTPSFRQFISHDLWVSLVSLCINQGVIPPRLTSNLPSRKRRIS